MAQFVLTKIANILNLCKHCDLERVLAVMEPAAVTSRVTVGMGNQKIIRTSGPSSPVSAVKKDTRDDDGY
jgi:hypothetical protein